MIDPDAPSATCPAGHTTTDAVSTTDHKGQPTTMLRFDADTCQACPLRPQCVKGKGPRTITLNVHEALLLKARAQQQRPSIRAKLKRRAVIERKIDHLQDLAH